MFFLSVCGRLLTSSLPDCFRAKSRSCLDLCDDRVAGFRMCRFGFLSAYMLSVFVCGSGRKSVFHLEILMFHVSLSKMCREEGQVLCSKDFFFFTRFWYHVSLKLTPLCPRVCSVCSPSSVSYEKRMCAFVCASSIGKAFCYYRRNCACFFFPETCRGCATKVHVSFNIVVTVTLCLYDPPPPSSPVLIQTILMSVSCSTPSLEFSTKRPFLCKYTCRSSYD